MELDALYKEVILDHQRDPRNFGEMTDADVSHEGYNPLCGDRVKVYLKFDSTTKKVKSCQFVGEGCSICMASTSMMTEEVEGKPVDEVLKEIQNFRDFMQDKGPGVEEGSDLEALQGVKAFPVRIKCALLPWTTLKEALEDGGNDHE